MDKSEEASFSFWFVRERWAAFKNTSWICSRWALSTTHQRSRIYSLCYQHVCTQWSICVSCCTPALRSCPVGLGVEGAMKGSSCSSQQQSKHGCLQPSPGRSSALQSLNPMTSCYLPLETRRLPESVTTPHPPLPVSVLWSCLCQFVSVPSSWSSGLCLLDSCYSFLHPMFHNFKRKLPIVTERRPCSFSFILC